MKTFQNVLELDSHHCNLHTLQELSLALIEIQKVLQTLQLDHRMILNKKPASAFKDEDFSDNTFTRYD